MRHLILTVLLAWISTSHGLLGYDCGGEGLNITTLSLLDIGDCALEDIEPKTEEVQVQLMQLSEYEETSVIQCKIEIDRTIYYCGMHSHTSVVHGGRRGYIHIMSETTCKMMQDSGTISLGGNALITGLKVNRTETRGITLAGSIGLDGRCTGTQYSDPYGTWDNVVVQASVKIFLKKRKRKEEDLNLRRKHQA